MPDREKIISNFEHEVNKAHGEGWDFVDLSTEDAKEILALLKAKYKPRESNKILPCKCGCKRREHWFLASYDNPEGLRCIKCGFTVWGKSATDAIRKWNEAVSQNDKA